VIAAHRSHANRACASLLTARKPGAQRLLPGKHRRLGRARSVHRGQLASPALVELMRCRGAPPSQQQRARAHAGSLKRDLQLALAGVAPKRHALCGQPDRDDLPTSSLQVEVGVSDHDGAPAPEQTPPGAAACERIGAPLSESARICKVVRNLV